jgi:hypothetical protein
MCLLTLTLTLFSTLTCIQTRILALALTLAPNTLIIIRRRQRAHKPIPRFPQRYKIFFATVGLSDRHEANETQTRT